MNLGEITATEEWFSYKGQKFSNKKFILSTRDDRNEHYIIPIIAVDNGKLIELDEYEFNNHIFAARPPSNNFKTEDLPLSRFSKNELLKLDYGSIIENAGAENPYAPKIKTFNANIHRLGANQAVEFFEGSLNERLAHFTPTDSRAFDLIKDVYVDNENCFFIIEQNKLIGPFSALKVNDDSFEVVESDWARFGEYNLSGNSYLQFEVNEFRRRIFITDCNSLNLDFKTEYKFISDNDLLKEFENELQKYPDYFQPASIENLKKILNSSSELHLLQKYINGSQRLKELVEKSEKILKSNVDLLSFFPDVKKLKNEKEQVEESLFYAKKEFQEQINELNVKVDELVTLKETLQNEIDNLEQTKREEGEKTKTNLDNEIAELIKRRDNLTNEVEETKSRLDEDLKEVQEDIVYYERSKKELQETIDNLRDEFREEQKQSQISLQNLVKSKIHFDFISGRDLSEQERENDVFNSFSLTDRFGKNQYRDFRNEVLNIFKQNNRLYDTHFIDNLLISIFQNTLTIFAGVPGTGKTTLARILTKILTPKERIREISVNRGWTSQKDFIGFVNPLTKKFHSSSTDFYSLLKQLDAEANSNETYMASPMAFVVLDEANLSPLEHYWSSFYNLTDSSGMLELKLGHDEIVQFPNNLRFIGTINYDHTTEELSPRILDRINVIQLDKVNDLIVNSISQSDITALSISFQRCIDFFELTDFKEVEIKLSDITETSYKVIKNEFHALRIFISNRVEIAIKRYISLAAKYMTDVNKPLDYCVAQRLLPLVNLNGADYKLKLESLRDKLKENKCEISVKILDSIIETGSEKGIYEDNFNYFLTLSNV